MATVEKNKNGFYVIKDGESIICIAISQEEVDEFLNKLNSDNMSLYNTKTMKAFADSYTELLDVIDTVDSACKYLGKDVTIDKKKALSTIKNILPKK